MQKLTTTADKVSHYKDQANIVFHLFMKLQQNPSWMVDLQWLLSYTFTAVPYNLATADSILAKTDKSNLLFTSVQRSSSCRSAKPKIDSLCLWWQFCVLLNQRRPKDFQNDLQQSFCIWLWNKVFPPEQIHTCQILLNLWWNSKGVWKETYLEGKRKWVDQRNGKNSWEIMKTGKSLIW